jgi:hypothetical protein
MEADTLGVRRRRERFLRGEGQNAPFPLDPILRSPYSGIWVRVHATAASVKEYALLQVCAART